MDLAFVTQSLFTALGPCTERDDASTVERAVRLHCRRLDLDASHTQAAVSVALATPDGRPTLDAVRIGRQRADALAFRQMACGPRTAA